MNLFQLIFNRNTIQCPRCLGKGHVDWNDIKRLNMELKWIPGPCAYCNGKGRVNSKFAEKIAVETTYLTTDLSKEERKRLISEDEGALYRAKQHELERNTFIKQIEYLHSKGNMNSRQIANFFFLHQEEVNPNQLVELMDYINQVIKHKKNK